MPDNPIEAKLRAAYAQFAAEEEASAQDAFVLLGAAREAPAVASALPPERVISVTVYVLGINEEFDEPDLFETQVTCTEQEYYEEGVHLAMAETRARAAGFVEPMFSFDERETRLVARLQRTFGAGAR
jgi:hypothetical protein